MPPVVSLSMEIELMWGHHDKIDGLHPALSEGRKAETEALERLLDRCDELGIEMTFGVVGHLFHDACDGRHESPHDEGWFASDPGTTVETDPHYYAPDLVAMIRDAVMDHEIATHTYSHTVCTDVDSNVVQWELAKVDEQHGSVGLESPESFIPPRHELPPLPWLREHGLRCFRAAPPYASVSDRGKIRTYLWKLMRRHPSDELSTVDDSVKTVCTRYPSLTADYLPTGQSPPHPTFRLIPLAVRQRLHARYLRNALKAAIDTNDHLHLWTHLYNLSNDAQWSPVESFLERLRQERDRGRVIISPMRELPSETGQSVASTN